LAENCFVTSNARTVDWQAWDCVLLSHAELQTGLGQFEAASCNAAAQFELLSDFCLFWASDFRLILSQSVLSPAMPELLTGMLVIESC
jgi:hypothetical protein